MRIGRWAPPPQAIYLDHLATTPVLEPALEAMFPFWRTEFGNSASGGHAFGQSASRALDRAREQVLHLLGASPDQPPSSVIWTSGATESIHLAILGSLKARLQKAPAQRLHIISSTIEHKATLGAIELARELGCRVTLLSPQSEGLVSSRVVLEALEPDTFLVTLAHGNNEIGSITDAKSLGAELKRRGVLFHLDAAQSAGKIPIRVSDWSVDLVSISGHKFGGPKGIGALYRGPSAHSSLKPLMRGGGHEFGLRPGTVNVPGAVGLGAAASWCLQHGLDQADAIRLKRDRLGHRVLAKAEDTQWAGRVHLNGPGLTSGARLPNHLSLTFEGLEATDLESALAGVAYTAASACTGQGPSHVIQEIWRNHHLQEPSVTLRLGLSWSTTDDEIEWLCGRLDQLLVAIHPIENAGVFTNP